MSKTNAGDKPDVLPSPPGLTKPGEDKPPAPKPSDSGEKTPLEWFRALSPAEEQKSDKTNRLAQHNAASAMHGWKLHRHHTGKAILLKREDYQAALAGAASGKGRKGLHAAALSPNHARKAR